MSRAQRKQDHITHALATGFADASSYDDLRFVHNSLPGSSVSNISYTTNVGGLSLSSPIIINAMTGGGGEKTESINRMLAQAAKATDTAMAVGSQMSAIKDTAEAASYQVVRSENPDGIIFANLGSEATPKQAAQAVDMIEADALQIHLNVIQELVMPEGDRDFKGALDRIMEVQQSLNIPIIVKEVGFGMSAEAFRTLENAGITVIDTGGSGGTNFSAVENSRREAKWSFFDQWGISSAAAVAESAFVHNQADIIGSGGIRHALDAAKAIALGASAVGIAGKVLEAVHENGAEGGTAYLKAVLEQLTYIMAAVGAEDIHSLQQSPLVLSGETAHWLKERGFDTKSYAARAK